MRKILIAVVLMAMLAPVTAWAVTLDDAIDIALKNSEAARIAGHSAELLRGRGMASAASTWPQVSLDARYMGTGTTALDTPWFRYPSNDLTVGVEATQALWAGGRISAGRRLGNTFKQRAAQAEQAGLRDLRLRVRLAYYGALYQRALLEISADRVQQRRAELADARDLWDAGVVTGLDVRQARVVLNQALDALSATETSYEEALIEFDLALGRTVGAEHMEPDGVLAAGSAAGLGESLSAAEAAFKQDRLLALRLGSNALRQREDELKIATSGHLPALGLYARAEHTGEQGVDLNEAWSAGIRLSWSLSSGGAVLAERTVARSMLQSARESLSLERKRLGGQLKSLRARAESVSKRIELQEETEGLSAENYRDARGQYRAGTITQTRLGDFNLGYAEARFGLSRLYFLQSRLLSEVLALLEGV